jgi:hypothetical protein
MPVDPETNRDKNDRGNVIGLENSKDIDQVAEGSIKYIINTIPSNVMMMIKREDRTVV